VSFNREDTLKKAEKLLRQGRLEPAIAEYIRVVEAEPGDWITTNTLGDLYVRAGQPDKAAAQFSRIAAHFATEGFLPKAAALYKKLLKLTPDDELAQLQLADISHRQGLLADSKAHFNAVAARRRARGDRAGAAEVIVRLGSVDPNDVDARLAAARTLAEIGDETGAASSFRRIHDDLAEKDRPAEALVALRHAVGLNPHDQEGRVLLAKAAVAAGNMEEARTYLDRQTAGSDPGLLLALLDIDLKSGRLDDARQLLPELLALGPEARQDVTELAWSTAATGPDAAFVIVEAIVETAVAAGSFSEGATILQDFVARVPGHIPALLKLIEACVDGGLEPAMNAAQAQLADAYLVAGQAAEARVIAEDLVAREPWEREHIERFRRALVMLKMSDPDAVIAERLSGMSPFLATDVFADPAPAVEPPAEAWEGPPAAAEEPRFLPHEEQPISLVEEPPPLPPDESPLSLQDEAPAPAGDRVPVSSFSAEESPRVERAGAEDPLAAGSWTAPSPDAPLISLRPFDAGSPSPFDDFEAGGAESELDLGLLTGEPTPEDDLGAAFQSMRTDAAGRDGTDQSAQHMTLARTYLEMGLADQAIASFKVASRAPMFRFEAASALGRIYKERGEIADAAEWLERASEAPAPSRDEGVAVSYDLGVALEERGETARALAIFLELQSEAGEYRDVTARIERLARVETETEG
jgi:tetratricopeptide (TPR) repeat protein